MSRKQSSAIGVWQDGNTQVSIPIGDPEGSPFIVQASGSSWIPVSVIIFASSEEDAINRVREGIRKVGEVGIGRHKKELSDEILALHRWEAFPFDKTTCTKIAWADNDTIGGL